MRLVFGWYSFKIKSFSPKDLNLPVNTGEDTSIEIRQKVFHLFWIPTFPIGKKYTLRKNKILYELPSEIELLVKAKERIKTPWYAYSLPILLILAGLSYLTFEKYEYYQDEKRRKNMHQRSVERLDKHLLKLNVNHFIKLKKHGPRNGSGPTYIKFLQKNKSRLQFHLLETGEYHYPKTPIAIKDHYDQMSTKLDTVSFTLVEVQNSICHEYLTCTNQKLLEINDNYYSLEDIHYINGPIIKDRGTGSYGNSIRMDLHNYGSPADLVEIVNIKNSINWVNLPMHVEHHEYSRSFSIKGENYNIDTDYKFMLIFNDSLNREHKFIVEGKNLRKNIYRILD